MERALDRGLAITQPELVSYEDDLSKLSPIGVFDSGSGGLTVYKALRARLPNESFVYLGDTARLPYGTKSSETVGQYVLQAAQLLLQEDVKLLVIACNTASALALRLLQANLPSMPCFGVIEPGAEAAVAASKRGHIAVMATESTVRSGAYEDAILKRRPDANIRMLACNLLVGLVEEGWWEGTEAEIVTGRYLKALGKPGEDYDTLVLGCTHFPLLAPVIRRLTADAVPVIDSAVTTAIAVQRHLEASDTQTTRAAPGSSRFLVTDSPERFNGLAARLAGGDGFETGSTVFHVSIGTAEGKAVPGRGR
ncbi:MAG: glutamate racemase [Pseudomonadota bacterium]|nr:glutamate racemase [Pseudomonadota bacterium]